jgi:predicted nucleic acid-binding protein
MPTSYTCVDASLLIKLVVPEPYAEQADNLWRDWIQEDTQAVAPPLLHYELTAVLRKKVYRKQLTDTEADLAFAQAMALEVELVNPDDLHERAWALARHFNQPTAYDSHYVALAEILNVPLWTADERLFNTLHSELDWVHWLGDYQSNPPG